jgi:hypothetical protein
VLEGHVIPAPHRVVLGAKVILEIGVVGVAFETVVAHRDM